MNSLSRRRFLHGGLNVLGVASVATVVAPLDAFAASPTITTQQLTPKEMGGLMLLQGAGCNVVALPGPDGALLIDGGLAANSKALLRAVSAATGTRRVNTLINTHWHPEQTGSNEAVGRDGALIISHEVTRLYEGRKASSTCYAGTYGPLPVKARSTKTTRDTGSLEFAGQHVDYGYLPAAHTDGDLYVHFPELNVLVAGGPVAGNRWPLLDTHNGGWLGGLVRAYEKLATVVKADTRIVTADGKLLTGADITRYRDIYDKLFKQMFVYFNHGYGPSDAAAARPLKDHEDEFGDASAFLAGAYRSILQAYVPD
ncbi:MAG TPA: MBL fold metallo-hydrolase [Steroidobacteraceae bacterium]|jgi:glyoxylase-like metal-dependent hydrolase (beta-lactamase superfamily II)